MQPDTYIYQADVYCEACAEDIKTRLTPPADPDDETSYDSDVWPKGPFYDEPADTPQHCGSGPDCLDPTDIDDGTRVGKFLENPLTDAGTAYVQELLDGPDPGPVALFWGAYYQSEGYPLKMPKLALPETLLTAVGSADGTLPAYAHPGGYPILYLCADGGTLCPDCANGRNGSETRSHTSRGDKQWTLCGYFVHYEGPPAACDHCQVEITSAYGNPDDDNDNSDSGIGVADVS